MKVAAVVLAAGGSSRLGSPKQLVRLGAENLLERAVRVAREAGCGPVVVVLGASADLIRLQCELGDACVVVNEDWASGMGGSIGVGVGALQGVDGCVVMTCDMPAVTAAHLSRLIGGAEVTASRYAGRNGIPAFFPKTYFDALMALMGDKGARELLVTARSEELADGELDVDTVGDLERAKEMLGLS
ncbi:molybdenum cofactor cytidylyltransferase [Edaphobacter aggregans]|uniref:Molybdenum cofactor cytidylyltransferase n=1 Tax=Edaphobacter aggregans TaxID=570835 RepID=A0A3R9WFA5_9BACT|nr:nucleotidyltransferase family protein [Edaphobacter aggregans]RSL15773.1 molybdenum cofactor cytidylyltransferase [Edaphobacter aggregans]